MTESYGQDLWNRHEHREEGHASQQATKHGVGVRNRNRWGNRIWKHSRLQGQSFGLTPRRIAFIPKTWNQSAFGIILAERRVDKTSDQFALLLFAVRPLASS